MNLYVRHILHIKKVVFFFIDVRTVGFSLSDKIEISLPRRTFLKTLDH
jgi:hypothetical protein